MNLFANTAINLIAISILLCLPIAHASTLDLTASKAYKDSTGNSYATIRWTSSGTKSCTAVGGWSSRTATSSSQYLYPIKQTTTYQMICSGSAGSVTKSVTVTPVSSQNENTNTATLDLTASKAYKDSTGNSYATIRWTSSGTKSCTAVGGWSSRTATSSSQYLYPIKQTTTYQMICSGSAGSVTKSVTVTPVSSQNENTNTATLDLTASKAYKDSTGNSYATIRWTSSGTKSCTAVGGWSSRTATSSSQYLYPIKQTTTYQMICSGSAGSVTKSVTVTPVSSQNENTNTATLDLTASKAYKDSTGNSYATIRWTSSGTKSCTAVGGWSSRTATSSSQYLYPIKQTTTYQMICSGSAGSVTKSVTVTPVSSQNENTNTATLDLTASKAYKDSTGNSYATIRWTSSGTKSCTAVGGWSSRTATSSSQYLYPIKQTTTYQMICSGSAGSVTKAVTISSTTDDNEKPQQSAPTLTLTSDLISIDANGSTTIRWASNNATRCSAQNNWSSKTDTTGKQYVNSIENTTSFTMTCIGDGGSVSKSVLVTVNDPTPSTGSANLSWSAPATNQDGSQLNDLASYKIYYGSSQSNLNNVEKIDAGLTSYVVENLSSGTHYFSMTAIDTQGNESTRSNIAAKVVN